MHQAHTLIRRRGPGQPERPRAAERHRASAVRPPVGHPDQGIGRATR